MIDELKQYKAFGKFVEWMLPTYRMRNGEFIEPPPPSRVVSERELISLLVEFCDSKGYIITYRWYFDSSESFKGTYECEIYHLPDDHCCLFTTNGFDNRTEATQAAIVKCFELMENEK